MVETQLIFKRSPAVVAAAVGEKSFLLHIEQWVYLELNDSGSHIWELLDGERSVSTILQELERDFNVRPEVCAADTSEFLANMEAKHFVTREK